MSTQGRGPGAKHPWHMALGAAGILLIAAWQTHSSGQTTSARVVLYAAAGPELIQYDVDAAHASLTRRASVTLPANVQEGWAHPSKPILYVTWSSRGPGGELPDTPVHGLSAFAIDRASGALRPLGDSIPLAARSIHVTTDIPGEHVLVAYNEPPGLTVHRIQPDGTLGSTVAPASPLTLGIYPHHVRVDPSNRSVIVVSRGNNPTSARPEDPGSLNVFSYTGGVLANLGSVAPGGGFGFQSRHVDFHPARPWVFLTLERQNKLQVFQKRADGMLSAMPLFSKDTLVAPDRVRPGQSTASIRVHPNGRFVYLSNRANGTMPFEGQAVFAGGENSIAVFRIDQDTGEPALVQNADTRGFTPRTFGIDPGGRLLVVANQSAMAVREGNRVRTVPASLSLFRIRDDGTLEYARTYDVETAPTTALFWMALVPLR